MSLKYFILPLFIFISFTNYAQNNKFISGIITDKSSGEALIGASIRFLGAPSGTSTNGYGHFSIVVAVHNPPLIISCIGFQTDTISVANANSLKIELIRSSTILQEVRVLSETVSLGSFNQLKIPIKMVEKLPSLLGETDILKNIQMLPGVQGGVEGTSGFSVRGGSPDQNLILLDGVPVYNVNHLFGFFSTFNTDAISNVDFYKNIIPTRFGGRLSSVVDVKMKEGNNKVSIIDFALSPISGRLLFESPLVANKASLMISYRRTWLDLPTSLLLNSAGSESNPQLRYFFDDFNAKVNYQISSKDKLFLSYYTGDDDFKIKNTKSSRQTNNKYGFDWGNQTFSLRWNRSFSAKLFANTQLGYSKFYYNLLQSFQSNTGNELINYTNQVNSGIKDIFIKSDVNFLLNAKHELSLGGNLVKHQFSPESKQTKSLNPLEQPSIATIPVIEATELGLYIEDKYTISPDYMLTTGLRQDAFMVDNKWYSSLQPRISLAKKVNPTTNLEIGYGRTTQFIHLVINASLSLPTDLWIPSTERVKPENAQIISVGFQKIIPEKGLVFSAESYYKSMIGLVEYKEGSPPLNDNTTSWQDRITTGKGNSLGLELMLQKNIGKFQGWVSYTLAWTNRTFSELNAGKTFPYKYDRRHHFTAVMTYDFSHTKKHKRTVSANVLLSSGMAVTFATNQLNIPTPDGLDLAIEDLSERNNFRTPIYHRMDISYQATRFKNHGNSRTWSLGLYNVYNRANANTLYSDNGKIKQISLLPIMPSISYQRSF